MTKKQPSDFICIAHRGASGNWPENTLLAFQKALAAGARWLELDVHLSRDGQLMVIHDATLQRTTNGRGPVGQYSQQELRQLDAGSGEKIPLLEEVLDLARGRALVNIELKGKGTGEVVAAMLRRRFAAQKLEPSEILASSLYEEELRKVSGRLPQVPLALVAERANPHLWQLAEELNAWSLNLEKSSINQALLEEAGKRNKLVLAYTVNSCKQMMNLKRLGVAGVFTDFPEKFVGA